MPYCQKENVNQLTALLVAHGIGHAVVCPGSRNAPIVHNLNECPDIKCYPVTDERSAGFFALGIAQALDEPVVVCVTSGSALLNLAPAVAEAYYQHQSLVVVSADRPEAWIDQLDGQTLRQPDALKPWTSISVSLPEPTDTTSYWYSNRLINEALLDAWRDYRPCVHINVPISEPLFQFSQSELPHERVIRRFSPAVSYDCLPTALVDGLMQAERPMIVVGQMSPHRLTHDVGDMLFSHVIVMHEALSPFTSVSLFDRVLAGDELPDYPDFILYVGGGLVSKRLKHYLRQAHDAQVWRVSEAGQVEDTFQNLTGIMVGDAESVMHALGERLIHRKLRGMNYRRQWLRLLRDAKQQLAGSQPATLEEAAVSRLEQELARLQTSNLKSQTSNFKLQTSNFKLQAPPAVHYANSTAVRLANVYAAHHVWCNRGVNGIEGSLSTAAGHSLVVKGLVFCVIGDLSFFYDQNALWQQQLGSNLRILLLNNGGGAIFKSLPGLDQSAAFSSLVAASHSTSAEGICTQFRVDYQAVSEHDKIAEAVNWLTASANRPRLLEVRR